MKNSKQQHAVAVQQNGTLQPVDTAALVQQIVDEANADTQATVACIQLTLANSAAAVQQSLAHTVQMAVGKDAHADIAANAQVVERTTSTGDFERIYSTQLNVTIDCEAPRHR